MSPELSSPAFDLAEQAALTHSMVAEQYRQQQDPVPVAELQAHMDRLAAAEVATTQQAETFVTEIPEAEVPKHEITAEHHMAHVELVAAVDPRADTLPDDELDLMGELMEIGATSINDRKSEKEARKAASEYAAKLIKGVEGVDALLSSEDSSHGLDVEKITARFTECDWGSMSRADADKVLRSIDSFDFRHEFDARVSDRLPMGLMGLAVESMPDATMAELYEPIDGQPSELQKYFTAQRLVTDARAEKMFKALDRIYANKGGLLEMPEGVDPNIDKLKTRLDLVEMAIYSLPEAPEDPKNADSIYAYETALFGKLNRLMLEQLNIPKAMSRSLAMSLYPRLMAHTKDGDPLPYSDGKKAAHAMHRIKAITDELPESFLTQLHTDLGVLNLDKYTSEDLRTLDELRRGDERTVANLQAGDVTVVFADAYGDHNGALTGSFDTYRKDSGRTLMFEVAQPGDFYRRMVLLKRLGVQPSTLVVAAHGLPGKTAFGRPDEANNFVLTSNELLTDADYDTHIPLDKAHLDRLVGDEFMQSSKGIDDTGANIGKRRVIFNSCSSDAAYMDMFPSSIETVVRAVNRPDTEGYGASDTMYLGTAPGQIDFYGRYETENGKVFRPNGQVVTANEPSRRQRLSAKLTDKEYYYVGQKVEIPNRHLNVHRVAMQTTTVDNAKVLEALV